MAKKEKKQVAKVIETTPEQEQEKLEKSKNQDYQRV